MQRVLTAIVLVPLVLLAVFKAPIWLYVLIIVGIALLCTREYLALVAAHGLQPLRMLTYVAVGAVIADYYLSIVLRGPRMSSGTGWRIFLDPVWQYEIMLVLVSAAPLVLLAAAMLQEDLRKALPSAAASYIAVPYIGVTLGFMIFSRMLIEDGAFAVLYLLLVVWAGDICAYYVGRALGKHPMAPRISPGKSWEGAAASVIGSAAVGCLLLSYNAAITGTLYRWQLLRGSSVLSGAPHPQANEVGLALLVSVSINIAAQVGDLLESSMKRGAGVKDSGALLPGHGGMLDRIDALLLASPVLWYYASFRRIHF